MLLFAQDDNGLSFGLNRIMLVVLILFSILQSIIEKSRIKFYPINLWIWFSWRFWYDEWLLPI